MSSSGERNWANQTIWTGDNLPIMRGMNCGSVDLIYLDPPFNSKADYAAPIGSQAAGAVFKDTWGLDDINLAWWGEIRHENTGLYDLLAATRRIHGDSMMSYLIYMAIRIMEIHRILKPTGSVYLHCDPTASHYLKLLMDCVFGADMFRNEIIWGYTGPGSPKMRQFNRKHDVVFWFAKSDTWVFNGDDVRLPHKDGAPHSGGFKGTGKPITDPEYAKKGKIPETWWTDIAIAPRSAKEYLGYPTQKPLALLRRIIKASSNEGDVVLDPFCGCATACIAAEMEGRQWAGIDISPKAADLVASRLQSEVGLFFKGVHRKDIPERSDIDILKRYNHPDNKKWLYDEQGGFCNGCQEHFQSRNMTIDHIIARTKGGTDHISNLQLLCGACNSVKGDRPQEYLIKCLTDKGWIKREKTR